MKKLERVCVPTIEEINIHNLYEHTPVNPYKGQYPRFIRPVGVHRLRQEWEWVRVLRTKTNEEL